MMSIRPTPLLLPALLLLSSLEGTAQQAPPTPVSPAPAVAAPDGSGLPPAPTAPVAVPDVAPIIGFVPGVPSAANQPGDASPTRSAPSGLQPRFLGFLGPYRRPHVPELFPGTSQRLQSLVHDGKLYLSARDAISLAIENNLDVEVERDNLLLADTDRVRAQGGGSLRGIDYTIQESPNGVGGPGSPLLNTTAASPHPPTPTVTDLTSLNSSSQVTSNLGSSATYSAGPAVPLYDPSFILTGGYLRRSDTVTLTTTTGTSTGTTTQTQPLNFIAANAAFIEGFRTGAQLTATANNDSAVVYGSNSQHNPFSQPSTSITVNQPLLRGFGGDVNLRYLHIANLNRKVSRLLFEQQVLETVYGISRLYFDLVSLSENVAVKQESLRAATRLRDDESSQVDQGTLAPIELTRATALVSSSQFDLIQAQGLYRQQEVILRNQLIRTTDPVFSAQFNEIVPTDHIIVPPALDQVTVADLIQQGLARRPDLAQSELQIKTGQISVAASRNQALPQLNAYANIETRGSSEVAYEQLGTPGTGIPTVPQNLALGGLRVSTIYQAGVQLTLPLRNRVAQADAARDTVQLRQTQARTEKLSNTIRQDIENAQIALETAFAAYKAAVTSRGYQEELLSAERDKLEFGQSTHLLVLQNEAFLAQARSTEIAARSNYIKARIEVDHAIGDLLEKNGISLDDAIQGQVK
jgi:outer membrane protein TolC